MCLRSFLLLPILCVAVGCDGDNITITNEPTVSPEPSPLPTSDIVGDFVLSTEVETDFYMLLDLEHADGARDQEDARYTNSQSVFFNKEGYLQTSEGLGVMGFPARRDGSAASAAFSSSEIVKVSPGEPMATSEVNVVVNLPSDSAELGVESFEDTFTPDCKRDPNTYNAATSVTIYDSLRSSHVFTLYFIYVSKETHTWQVKAAIGCDLLDEINLGILDFNDQGDLDLNDSDADSYFTAEQAVVRFGPWIQENEAEWITLSVNFASDESTPTTSFSSNFQISGLEANGWSNNQIMNVNIDENGVIRVQYVRGDTDIIGIVGMAKFPSPANLESVGSGVWAETEASGEPEYGSPNLDNYGKIVPVTFDY